MQTDVYDSLSDLDPVQWNALNATDNPFLRYEFLQGLEEYGCVGKGTGWLPQHLVLSDNGQLVGAAPTYQKTDSYGEFIFDWSWANAYHRCGTAYYPKLVTAVPFTPATGPRLLVGQQKDIQQIEKQLVQSAIERAKHINASTIHWLFTTDEQTRRLASYGLMRRVGYQFHWQNQGFRTFDDFLATLTAKKRKNLKRERRRVTEMGITMNTLKGNEVSDQQWALFHRYYADSCWRKGGTAYLTEAFLKATARRMPDHVLLITASYEQQMVAAAFCLTSHDTFYGRYWGCLDNFHSLHFETCYYTPIDFCISHGLSRFEAGAQGEHKISRGFLPTPIYSAHWVADPQFRQAISRFLDEEERFVNRCMDELDEHSPFRAESMDLPLVTPTC